MCPDLNIEILYPFRSRGDPSPLVSGLDDILPREPVVRVVNMPQLPPQHPLAQNGTPRAISQNGTTRNSEITHAELSETLKSELVQKWQRKLGSKYQIIVSSSTERKRVDSQDYFQVGHVKKIAGRGGLGISLEGTGNTGL